MIKKSAEVISQSCLAEGIYDLLLQADEIAEEAKAGQFVNVYTQNAAKLLPRPISLCGIDKEKGRIRLVYRVTAEAAGTAEFSALKSGDKVDILGPLGNGYELKGEHPILVGGGIGVPPMLELGKELAAQGKEVQFVLGYRNNELFLADEFQKYGKLIISTDDGSVGIHGTVVDAIRLGELEGDVIYSCGPTPMLRGLKELAIEWELPAYLSLEQRMACGIGACLACVCKTKEKDEHSQVNNARVCVEGPVFEAREVEL